MTEMKRFEELLDAYANAVADTVRHVQSETWLSAMYAARLALVEYVQDRMKPEPYTDDLCPTHGTNYNKACHACVSLLMREEVPR